MKRDITINDLICNETLPIRVSWKKKLSGIYEKKEGSLVINRDKLKRMCNYALILRRGNSYSIEHNRRYLLIVVYI